MTQPDKNPVCNTPLTVLVPQALNELNRLGYSRRSIRRYRLVWEKLIIFSEKSESGNTLSENLAESFIKDNQAEESYLPALHMGWQRHIPFMAAVLVHFSKHGDIKRFVTDMQQIQVPEAMKKTLGEYEHYCKVKRRYRPSTLQAIIRDVMLFLDFLGTRNTQTLDQITALDLSAFIATRDHYTPRTVSRLVSTLRLFLQYLFMQDILLKDLSQGLPVVRVPRDATIPSVWDPQLIEKLLNAVDRSSPRGKRDYAILLLACRLGLRVGDIRRLTLDDLNWEAARIDILQSKTQTPLSLPMTEEVGNALISYLESARPNTKYREVFLKLRSPFEPFPEMNHMHDIVSHWRYVAGITFRSAQHSGLHSLRHSCASQLLAQQVPLKTISDILGHTSTHTTRLYAKADIEGLRSVALDPVEVRDV
jgi:site-specific recombinase XerD